jgi:hypothetical protein
VTVDEPVQTMRQVIEDYWFRTPHAAIAALPALITDRASVHLRPGVRRGTNRTGWVVTIEIATPL